MDKDQSKDQIREQLNDYFSIFKEVDAIYSALARKSGLSDAAFWALYLIQETKAECTQKTIKDQWAMSKQTVNSAINDLVKLNLIYLSENQKDKRSKKISLTEKGVEFVHQHIDIISQHELSAFEQMTDIERSAMIATSRKYLELFRKEINYLLK
jgi:DNA-binding MarR family transcriptional regulator